MEENLEPKWYVLHTYSGYENVAKENLETMAVKYGLQDRIMDIIIPTENVIEEKRRTERKSLFKEKQCQDIFSLKCVTLMIFGTM